MADQNLTLGAKIVVDSGGAKKSIAEMQGEIKKLSTEMKNAKVGSDEYKQASEKLAEAQSALNNSTKEKVGTFGQLKEQLKGTIPALDGAASGVMGLGKQLFALAANPIVLIVMLLVGALKFLYDAFTYSVAGGKKMAAMFDGVKAAIEVVVDRAMKAGQAIIKFFSGDFKGAAKDMKAAFTGVGDAISKAYNEVEKATEALQRLKKQERESSVARAAQNAAIVKSKELLNDENASINERRAALKLVSDVERKIGEEDIKIAEERLKQSKILWGQTEEGLKKHAQEIAELEIAISEKREETSRKEIQLQRQTRTLDRQEKSKAKEEDDAARSAAKEAHQNLVEYKNKLLKLQQENELAIIRDGYEKEKKILSNNYGDEKRALDVSLQDHKITRQQYNRLNQEALKKYHLEMDALKDKHEKETKAKTVAFEKELSAIEKTTKLAGITDVRVREIMAIEEGYQQKRTAVLENEKLTAKQREILLNALAAEAAANKKVLEAKYELEDKGKKLKDQMAALKTENDMRVAMKVRTFETDRLFFEKSRQLERQDLVMKKATIEELTTFDEQTTIARIKLSEAERDAKLNNAKTVGGALSGLSELVGKQTAVGKALAVASSIINTYQGATKALAQGGIFGAVSAAGIIASGLASVRSIIATPVPGQSSSGSASVPSTPTAPSAPIIPQNQTTQLNQNSINAIGNAAAGRTFVVEKDITNNQERITRLNRAARLD